MVVNQENAGRGFRKWATWWIGPDIREGRQRVALGRHRYVLVRGLGGAGSRHEAPSRESRCIDFRFHVAQPPIGERVAASTQNRRHSDGNVQEDAQRRIVPRVQALDDLVNPRVGQRRSLRQGLASKVEIGT